MYSNSGSYLVKPRSRAANPETMTRNASIAALLIFALCLSSCGKKEEWEKVTWEELSEEEQHQAKFALASMEVHEGLEAELFAAEPMITNPTNLAVDAKGRVWVCEAINYRLPFNPLMEERVEGDRILILEDTDKDGKADKKTVFFQGPEVNAALGIAVLGSKVYVSHSPSILVMEDLDGDDVADRVDTLFTGIGGPDDDHGAHAIKFGPDGRLYFNFGNAGKQLLHKDGSPVLDQEGRPIRNAGKPYWQGMAFRCDPDGSHVEVLGHNFRNIYELDVDPYGSVWQTDNDDDGNRGCRFNFVMEYGNFGYRDEISGAGWQESRPGMSEEIPLRHWHLNDPGVVPNVLQTGAGSPAGIAYYRGDLLPEVFRNEVIHCEALSNVVRSYPVSPEGAGYTARIVNVMKSRDNWFRPSDVEVAPDGSLFVSDWYDAGVGGNRMDDVERGRIYRIAPRTDRYKLSAVKLNNPKQAVSALLNPNMDASYQGWTALEAMGDRAEKALMNLWTDGQPEQRAQALWLLARMPGSGTDFLKAALKDQHSDIRIATLRAARQLFPDQLNAFISLAVNDSSPAVRREAALALRYREDQEAAQLWARLADQYDGKDRWYLEALGIGADKRSNAYFRAWWGAQGKDIGTEATRRMIWRMRADTTLTMLTDLIVRGNDITGDELPGYFRAYHFKRPEGRDAELAKLVSLDDPRQPRLAALALGQISPGYVKQVAAFRRQVRSMLPQLEGSAQWLDAVESMRLTEQSPQLLEMYLEAEDPSLRQRAIVLLLEFGGRPLLEQYLASLPPEEAHQAAVKLGTVPNYEAVQLLAERMERPDIPTHQKVQLVEALGSGSDGQHLLFDWINEGRITDEKLIHAAAVKLMNCWDPEVRNAAPALLQTSASKDGRELPSVVELVAKRGDPEHGKEVYSTFCMTCHQVDGMGTAFGPDLSLIGDKLARKALYSSILYPSAGINFGYEGHVVRLKDGTVLNGILISETEEKIELRIMGGLDQSLDREAIASIVPMDQSLMTPNLHAAMSEQDLVDLVEYLSTLTGDTDDAL